MDLSWKRIKQTENQVIEILFSYVSVILQSNLIHCIFKEFVTELTLPNEELKLQLWNSGFIAWFLFNWIPAESTEDIYSNNTFVNKTFALQYLESDFDSLDHYQQKFIKNTCDSYYSFYKITQIIKDNSLTLYDLLLDKEIIVKEKQKTHYLNEGDIIYTKILTLENQSICIGMLPYYITSEIGADIMKLKHNLEKRYQSLNADILRQQLSKKLRHFYFTTIFNTLPQKLYNTNGDNICISN